LILERITRLIGLHDNNLRTSTQGTPNVPDDDVSALDDAQSQQNLDDVGEQRNKKSEHHIVPVMGIFRSGTNFARAILENNFHCVASYNHYGWKHGYFPSLTSDSGVEITPLRGIFVTKHPYSHMVSLISYIETNGRNFTVLDPDVPLIQSRIIVCDHPHRARAAEYWFRNLVDFYNSMNWNYFSTGKDHNGGLVHCDYHGLVSSPENIITDIANQLNLKRRDGAFVMPDKRMKNMPDRGADERIAGGIDAYTTAQNFKTKSVDDDIATLGDDAVAFIRDNVDHDLLWKLGYTL